MSISANSRVFQLYMYLFLFSFFSHLRLLQNIVVGFNLHFSRWCWASFPVLTCHSFVYFDEMCIQSFHQFLNLFFMKCVRVLISEKYKPFVNKIHDLQTFSLSLWLIFSFLSRESCKDQTFLIWLSIISFFSFMDCIFVFKSNKLFPNSKS